MRGDLVKSLLNMFDVPKESNNIWLVNDATKIGLNWAVWAPNFFLLIVITLARCIIASSCMSDVDMGKFSLNYTMDQAPHVCTGVDIIELVNSDKCEATWERWNQTLIFFYTSPYICIRGQAWIEEVILGNKRCQTNSYRWSKVVLNITGSESYNTCIPWRYKWDDGSWCIVADANIFVDDGRATESSEAQNIRATRRFASFVNYIGSQDAC